MRYDRLLRPELIKTTHYNGGLNQIHLQYTALGKLASKSLPVREGDTAKYFTRFAYDTLGRLTKQVNADGTVFEHRFKGMKKTTIDANGNETSTQINMLGQIVEKIEHLDATDAVKTIYSYSPFGVVHSITVDGKHTTTVDSDAYGNVTKITSPETGVTTRHFNAMDELVEEVNAKGESVKLAYDKLGRIISREDKDGKTSWIYDRQPFGIGALGKTISPWGHEEEYSYNDRGQLEMILTKIGRETFLQRMSYDSLSRLNTFQYPEGPNHQPLTVKYHYTSAGQLTDVSDADDPRRVFWKRRKVNVYGQTTLEVFGNRIQTERTFDERNLRLLGLTTKDTRFDIEKTFFTYDKNGNLIYRNDRMQKTWQAFTYTDT